jgi:hypothetical protein
MKIKTYSIKGRNFRKSIEKRKTWTGLKPGFKYEIDSNKNMYQKIKDISKKLI